MTNTDLVISAPRQGISQSPHVGFGDCRNLDVFTSPGIVKLNNLTAKASASTVTGLIQWMVKNPLVPTEVWGLDNGGQVYKSTDSGASWATVAGETAGGAGQGLAIWKDYLFVARTTNLDVYGPLTSGSAWSNSWKTIDSDALWHPMIVSKNDGKLYGGAGRFVYSLDEVTGQTFAPGTGATYTWTQQALDLPVNYRIKCLEELGNNLMCGTWVGTNVYDYRIADIFPWDRSAVSFGQPVTLSVNGIHGLLNNGNYLIVLAGIEGTVYRSDGVSATPIGQIPQSIADISGGKYLEWLPGAICNYKGRPFFGVSGGGTSAIAGMGVYSLLQTGQGTVLTHEHTVSTGNDGTSNVLKIGALIGITRDNILIGWRDNSTYGIDNITVTSFTTSYGGFFITPLYRVGTKLQPRKFIECEVSLDRPLRANEGIRLAYRTDLTSSFTTVDTYDFATYGAELSHNAIFKMNVTDIPASELLQLKVSITGTTTSPELRSLTLT